MSIDWLNFTPWTALGGGALIGLAVGVFVLANGRIAGISGLIGSVMQFGSEGWSEKALFLLGLMLAPLLWGVCRTAADRDQGRMADADHCGIVRRRGHPLRLWLHKWSWGLRDLSTVRPIRHGNDVLYARRFCNGVRHSSCRGAENDQAERFFAGLIFGLGLLLAGMANPAKVLAFLDVAGAWDPSLALVMGGAIAVAVIPLNWARNNKQSLLGAPCSYR
jgi:hypothetical protein